MIDDLESRKILQCTGVLPDLLPDVFCLMVRIFRLILGLLYI